MVDQGYTRTDLACEWGDASEGTRVSEGRWRYGQLQTLQICHEEAARRLGRPLGEYITVSCDAIWRLETPKLAELERVVARVLTRLLQAETGKPPSGDMSVLVVGLGNAEITADALGPQSVRKLLITRPLREQESDVFLRMGCCAVSALAPGVSGQTGMEVAEIIRGVMQRCKPDAVITVDALAARSCDRLASTVQLSNTGISPGSGIGNERCELNRQSLEVPVIAIGVPTVVDSSTLVYDALHEAQIVEIDTQLRQILDNGRRFYVAPKEIDMITARASQLLAHAINLALVGTIGAS